MLGSHLFENQRSIFEQLSSLIAQPNPCRGLVVGPSGAGKSWILERLYQELHESGHLVWLASGFAQGHSRSFEPFNSAINRRSSRLGDRRITVQGLSALSRAIPVVGSVAAFLTEWLANEKQRRRREATIHLRSDEFEVLSHLAHAAGNRQIILLADNLQHWDVDSLNLLLGLLGNRLESAFDFVRNLRIVATVSEDAPRVQAPELMNEIIQMVTWRRFKLPAIKRTEVNTALTLFGLPTPLLATDVDAIFSLTGGHLALIAHLSLYLRSGSASDSGLSVLNRDQLGRIFVGRLENLGENRAEIRTMLEIAAVIGEVSLIEEIACASDRPRTAVAKLIADGLALAMFSRFAGGIRFRHEIVRECILATLGDAEELHVALATCLRRLRPWDFRTRANHLLRGGHNEEAARLLFAENYRRHREGIPVSDAEENEAMLLLSAIGENEASTLLLRATYALRQGRWDDMERMLEQIPDTAHVHLVCEKLLLLAVRKMQSTKTADRLEALRLLRGAHRLELAEPDLQMRVQLTLLTALVHSGALSDARDLHLEISQRLGQLSQFDPHAAWMLQILNRKSGMLVGAERAAYLCKNAAAFFGPQRENESPRSPSQYYMALTNLAGNLLCCGRFRDAVNAAAEGLKTWDQFSRFHISKRDKCVANFALAAFLVGDVSARLALETLDAGIESESNSWFLRSNRAVLRALTGDLEASLNELDAAAAELDGGNYCDPHHCYIVRTNRAALLHLAGRTDDGLALWQRLAFELPPLGEHDRPFFVARQELQLPAFSAVAKGDTQGWFDYLQRAHPNHLGYGWTFWGRGFLLSDVQLWTES